MSSRRIEPFPGDLRPHFLEVDERVYVDDSLVPQLHGTGTEDFYEGGWFFDHGTRYSLPLTGQPSVRITDDRCEDYCVTAYRLMLAEAVDYRSSLLFGIEHGPENDEQAEYGSVAFFYTHRLRTTPRSIRDPLSNSPVAQRSSGSNVRVHAERMAT
ncbi:DUF2961 domain-containing protein [Nocardia sp. NBC_00403]|uniref:DUF2961 domain-containing protein n=1 Tax=Nocardia sp. NBC_00403 TaxID=2975990 RepID=UPI002E1F83D0